MRLNRIHYIFLDRTLYHMHVYFWDNIELFFVGNVGKIQGSSLVMLVLVKHKYGKHYSKVIKMITRNQY